MFALPDKPAGRIRESFLLAGGQLAHAVGTDVFPAECRYVAGVAAEHAGGLTLPQNDASAVHIDLEGILFRNVQGAPQLDGQNDAAQLVHLADDTS